MRQRDIQRVVAAIASGASLVAASVMLAASYLGPALFVAGINWGQPERAYADRSAVFAPLFNFSVILFIASLVLIVYALWPTGGPPHNPAIQRTDTAGTGAVE